MFQGAPTYPRNRNLVQGMHGEDVYALQTALAEVGIDPGPHDGAFGPGVKAAVIEAQHRYRLEADGVAGGATQAKLTSVLCLKARGVHGLPSGLAYGQTGHESGHRLGIYSWIIRANGGYDAGVAQLNTDIYPPQKGFDAAFSIDALGAKVAEHYEIFDGLPVRRRWGLASGAWNAPAYACYLAKREGANVPASRLPRTLPSRESIATLEAYIASATALLRL